MRFCLVSNIALMNGLADLGTVNPRIADDELARMAGHALADQIARIKSILKEQTI